MTYTSLGARFFFRENVNVKWNEVEGGEKKPKKGVKALGSKCAAARRQ